MTHEQEDPEQEDEVRWDAYLAATKERGPRPLLLEALAHEGAPQSGRALDLGCGAGGDTLALAQRGFRVTAVDRMADAVELACERANEACGPAAARGLCSDFAEVDLPPSSFDVVAAFFSLPFCAPERFDGLWSRLRRALRPGGLFVGQLFGDQDEWASRPKHPARVFVSPTRLQQLVADYEVLAMREELGVGPTAVGPDKRWHVWHLVLRAE